MFEIRSPTVYVSFIELLWASSICDTLQDFSPKNLHQPRQLMNEAFQFHLCNEIYCSCSSIFTPFWNFWKLIPISASFNLGTFFNFRF